MPDAPAKSSETMTAPPPARRALAPFKRGVYLAIWLGTLCSNMGVWIQSVGAAWLMTLITASPDWVALVQSASTLPVFLFSLAGGLLADKVDRRLAQVAGQAVVMTAALALALLDYLGGVTPWLLLSMTFLLGVGSAIRQPAFQASVSDLVPREEVPAAVALNSVNFNIARALGPGIGGLIVAAFGPPVAFMVNAGCNIVTIAVLLSWRGSIARSPGRRESVLGAISAGLIQVLQRATLRRVMVRTSAFCLFAAALWALLPVVTKNDLGGTSSTYGVLLGCLGFGAVLGAGLLAKLRRHVSDEALIDLGSVLFAIATAALAVAQAMPMPVLMPLLMIGGVAWMINMSTFSTTVQLEAPGWVKARVVAIFFMAMFGNLALGSWLWGLLAARVGVREALTVAAALLVASLALRWRFRMPDHPTMAA